MEVRESLPYHPVMPRKRPAGKRVSGAARIVSDPAICEGEPCVRGTRVPVHIVLGHLAAGDSEATILENFPRLTRDDVRACLAYAADLTREHVVPA